MRNEAHNTNNVTLSRVNGYHHGGYERALYFRSDRAMPLGPGYTRPDGQPLRGYGLEIESECSGYSDTILAELYNNIIFKHFPDGLFKMEHDGSLADGHSAECITQIMTKAFIRNHYRDFKAMYDTYFPAFDISCARTGHCGMHVNISNANFGDTKEVQDDTIRKLLYFVNRNFTMCCRMFKRNAARTGYCAQMPGADDKERAKRWRLTDRCSDHYCAYNLGHYEQGRIELRIVGGQADYYSFRNTMECVFWLVEHLRKVSWDKLDSMKWVFRGCNKYVYKRLMECGLSDEDMTDIRLHLKDEDLELRNAV